MKPRPNLAGTRSGKLLVMAMDGKIDNATAWLCRCDCGREVRLKTSWVHPGNRRQRLSCGCYRGEAHRTHGGSASDEFRIWAEMRKRCSNPKQKSWQHYGGRGISVCDRWQSFENFLADMGQRPSKGHSIDRIDNDGNYEPGNCRWATKSEQVRNTRRTKLSEVAVTCIRVLAGRGASRSVLAESFGVSESAISKAVTGRSWR